MFGCINCHYRLIQFPFPRDLATSIVTLEPRCPPGNSPKHPGCPYSDDAPLGNGFFRVSESIKTLEEFAMAEPH